MQKEKQGHMSGLHWPDLQNAEHPEDLMFFNDASNCTTTEKSCCLSGCLTPNACL